MKVLVIYNPAAGGSREAQLQAFTAALVKRGAEVEVYRSRFAGDVMDYLRGRGDQGDCVAVVGGDGTTNEVINGIRPGVPLGLFATGTANVLARDLALPRTAEVAAQTITHGRTLNVWPALLNGRRFCMWVGLGYDARVVHGANMALKKKIGKGAYIFSLLREVPHFGKQRYRLHIDGHPYDCYSAILTKGRHYAGGFVLSRRAHITRQSIQVILLQCAARWALLRFMVALLCGRVENTRGVLSIAARRVDLVSPEREALQVDGDPTPPLPVRVEVDTNSLPVRVGAG